jgi:thioredoxin reductase (NADPH)
VVVDASALGGQAGISDRIDNYPGFPEGISGAELAERFVAQARRYGVELLSAVSVRSVVPDADDLVTTLASACSPPVTSGPARPSSSARRWVTASPPSSWSGGTSRPTATKRR